ncbi:MAG: hypothetical protein K2O00_03990 [Muribaculaceae bacterium]|nr:hypothetical protein [Muribaculaceae bacterium]
MRRLRLLTLLLLLPSLALGSVTLSPQRIDSLIAQTPACVPVEGVWRFMPDNAAIAILRQPGQSAATGPLSFDIYLYSTVTARLKPGTLIGTLQATPEHDTYKASMLIDPASGSARHKEFTLRLKDPSHLTFTPRKKGLSISLWRLIPYLFRVSIIDNRGDELNGCVKLKPLTPGVSEPVRYL